MKWVVWHLPRGAQHLITWLTGYRVTALHVNGRLIALKWRRWPK